MEILEKLNSANFYSETCATLSSALESMMNFSTLLEDEDDLQIATEAATEAAKSAATNKAEAKPVAQNNAGIIATVKKWVESFKAWIVKKFSKDIEVKEGSKVEKVSEIAVNTIAKLQTAKTREEGEALVKSFEEMYDKLNDEKADTEEDLKSRGAKGWTKSNSGAIKGAIGKLARLVGGGAARAEARYTGAVQHEIKVATKAQNYINKHVRAAGSDEEFAKVMSKGKGKKITKAVVKAENARKEAEIKKDKALDKEATKAAKKQAKEDAKNKED